MATTSTSMCQHTHTRLQWWTANSNTINQHHLASNHQNPTTTTTSRTDKCDLWHIWRVSSSGKLFFIFLNFPTNLFIPRLHVQQTFPQVGSKHISSSCKNFFFFSSYIIIIIILHRCHVWWHYEHPMLSRNTNKVPCHNNGRSLRHLCLKSQVWWAQVSFDFSFIFTLPSAFYFSQSHPPAILALTFQCFVSHSKYIFQIY